MIQTLEDMLRACVLDFNGSWTQYITRTEFAYNNNYQTSIGMAPYKALYGTKCLSPFQWDEVGERQLIEPKVIQDTTEKIALIRKRLTETQNQQKSHAGNRRRDLEFAVGNKVFLKVA